MTGKEAHETFLGYALPDLHSWAAQRIPNLPADFSEQMQESITDLMRRETMPVKGAVEAVRAFAARGIPVSCCSNSGREELHVKMKCLGLHDLFKSIISYEDVANPKPAPDMYLKAAEASLKGKGAFFHRCLVIEDSIAGVRAGVAAGCHVVALAGNQPKHALEAAGAHTIIDQMSELVELFLP